MEADWSHTAANQGMPANTRSQDKGTDLPQIMAMLTLSFWLSTSRTVRESTSLISSHLSLWRFVTATLAN